MRIRTKLMLLLLGTAAVPLLVVSLLTTRATRDLGQVLGDRAREALAEHGRVQLNMIVEADGRSLEQEMRNLELTLELQAMAIERALRADPPQPSAALLFREDLAADHQKHWSFAPSDRHSLRIPDGTRIPLLVSYSQPVLLLAPGTNREVVAEDAQRLHAAAEEWKRLSTDGSRLIYWQYVALSSGLHMVYPGHGHHPTGFDPRRRAWYMDAIGSEGVVWSAPFADATTGLAVVAASRAVRDAQGRAVGVTGIDVDVRRLYDAVRLPSGWGPHADLFVVQVEQSDEVDAPRLRIVAQRDFEIHELDWDVPLQTQWLETPEVPEAAQLLDQMLRQESGVRRLEHEGRKSLWAHGPLRRQDLHLVVITEEDVFLEDAIRAESYVLQRTREQMLAVGAVLLVVLVGVVLAAMIGSRSVTRPIGELAAAAQRVAAGDLDAAVPVRTRDEVGQLGRVFNRMAPQLREGMRLRESLALAMQVQQSLLPAQSPRVPGFDIAGFSKYCDETGGDYYDFLDFTPIGPEQLDIAVGDVTGHGVAAALLMATARALLRGQASHAKSIDELVTDVNRHLAMDTPLDRFMTLFYGRLSARERLLTWASAGHDPGILYRPAADSFTSIDGVDLPLGVDPALRYTAFGPLRLEAGDVALIGTDGIWEARDPRGEMFGKDALRKLLRAQAGSSAQGIGQAVIDAVTAFRGSRPQQDDITLVVVKVLNGS